MDKEFYTELIYRHKTIEDYGPTVVSIKKNAWDLTLSQLFEMFHGICISATYTEETFKNALIEYLEYMYNVTVIEDEEDEKVRSV